MHVQYRIDGYIAHSERDNWQQGCLSPCKTEFSKEQFTAESFAALLDLLADHFKADKGEGEPTGEYWGDFILNSCEEPGRLDLQVNQREPFKVGRLSPATLEKWKAGEIDTWLTCYSFQVERVERGFTLGA